MRGGSEGRMEEEGGKGIGIRGSGVVANKGKEKRREENMGERVEE